MTGSDSREGLSCSTVEGQAVGNVTDLSGQTAGGAGWAAQRLRRVGGLSALLVGVVLIVRLLA